MMKKFYLSALLVGTTAIAIAQASDPAAKAILDGVSAKFKTFTTVQATFTYKVENAAGNQAIFVIGLDDFQDFGQSCHK